MMATGMKTPERNDRTTVENGPIAEAVSVVVQIRVTARPESAEASRAQHHVDDQTHEGVARELHVVEERTHCHQDRNRCHHDHDGLADLRDKVDPTWHRRATEPLQPPALARGRDRNEKRAEPGQHDLVGDDRGGVVRRRRNPVSGEHVVPWKIE